MDNISKFGHSVKWLFIGTIVSNVINLFISIFLIRKLMVDDFGIYSMFIGSTILFAVVSINGIIVTFRRFIPELIQKKYTNYLRFIIIRLLISSFVICTVLVIIVFIYKKEVGYLLNISQFEKYYTIFIVNIFLVLQAELCSAILISMYQQKTLSILSVLGVIVRGVLYLLLFSRITVELIFIIEAVTVGLNGLPQLWYLFSKVSSLKDDNVDFLDEKEEIKLNKRIARYTLLSTTDEVGYGVLNEISDFYFISAYLGPVAMGLYAFPYKLRNMVFNWIPLVQLNNVIKPFFISKYYAEGEEMDYLKKMFNFILKITVMITGITAGIIIAYQNMFHVYLFKSKYIQTQWLLILIMLFSVLQCIRYPLGIILEIKEKIEYNLYSKIFAVFNILMVLIVLKYTSFGLIGVAAATGISIFLRDYFIYSCMVKMTGISIDKSGLFRTCLMIVGFFGVIMLLRNIGDTVYGLIVPFVVAFCALIIFFRILKPLNVFEEELIGKVIDKAFVKGSIISRLYALNSRQ